MPAAPIDLDRLRQLLADPSVLGTDERPAPILVDLDSGGDPPLLHFGFPRVVVGHAASGLLNHPAAGACDVLLATEDGSALEAVEATVAASPIAATVLVATLRGSEHRSLDDSLMVESASYSALQAGPEFTRWRAARRTRKRAAEGPPVSIDRSDGQLSITLMRPHVRNALNTSMRDALVEAFRLVQADPTISRVHLRGEGAAFCAGGDLDEFGSFPDPATAHIVRLQQHIGRSIAQAADRVTAHLHGACYGSGIELPAFASQVLAAPDTAIALPELLLGLIPGAGGTVSLPRRIGRHRTARLALTGERLDARTALDWGLIDAIEQQSEDAVPGSS